MRYFLFSFVALGALTLFAMPVAAQEADGSLEEEIQAEVVTNEDLGVEDPGLLPTSRFYFLKNWGRGVQTFFSFGAEKKANLELKIANEKAAELKKVAEQSSTEATEKALENYRRSQEIVKNRLESLRETSENPNIDRLLGSISERIVLHEKLFDEIQKRHEEVGETVERVRERVRDTVAKAAEKDSPEKFKERLRIVLGD